MEAQQMACCGIFELAEIGDNRYWLEDEEDTYNPSTGEYEAPEKRTRPQALKHCKASIAEELRGIAPSRRLVLATTVRGMSIAQEALRSLGFTVAKRFVNGNTDNRITLYWKYLR
jgi:hypothetical protein